MSDAGICHWQCRPLADNRRLAWAFYLLAPLLIVPWTWDAFTAIRQGMQFALHPVPTCNTEMHILDGTACVAEGKLLYPAKGNYTLVYHLYGPLAYLPAGLIGRAWRLDLNGLLIAGRCISLAAMLGILMLVGWYVRRVTACTVVSVLAVTMLLYFHSSTLTDFFRNRPETLAILLSLAGWMLVQFRPAGWTIYAAMAFTSAIALKPSFVAAPLAVGIQLLNEREFRGLLKMGAISLGLCLLMAGGSYWLLGSGYFEHTVFAMLSDPMHPVERSLMFYPLLAMWHWRGLLPATLCSAAWLMRKKAASPLLIYLSVCFVVTTFAQGKVGSDLNYHGELSILMVLTTAVAIGEMLSRGAAFIYAPLTFLIVGTWGTILAFGPGWNGVSPNRTIPQPYYVAATTMRPAEDYVRRYRPYRGQALILDDEIAVRVGDPAVIDWYGDSFLFDSGHTDFQRLENAVRQQEFAVIVLAPAVNNAWSDRIRAAALASGYRLNHRDARVEEYCHADVRLPALAEATQAEAN